MKLFYLLSRQTRFFLVLSVVTSSLSAQEIILRAGVDLVSWESDHLEVPNETGVYVGAFTEFEDFLRVGLELSYDKESELEILHVPVMFKFELNDPLNLYLGARYNNVLTTMDDGDQKLSSLSGIFGISYYLSDEISLEIMYNSATGDLSPDEFTIVKKKSISLGFAFKL